MLKIKLNLQPLKIMTVAVKESAISRTQVQLWYNRFMEGRAYVNDKSCQQQDKIIIE